MGGDLSRLTVAGQGGGEAEVGQGVELAAMQAGQQVLGDAASPVA